MPNSVTNIGGYAFYGCSGLTSINIPNSVTTIGNDAFWGCNRLEKVELESIESLCTIKFKNTNSNPTSYAHRIYIDGKEVTTVNIPNSVTYIGNHAFRGCSELTSITIPNSVTGIGNYAFRFCTGLTYIDLPQSITSIGDGTFEGCSGIKSITIPERVTRIGVYTFCNSGLTSINIPNSVSSIGEYAFDCCSQLTSINIPSSVTRIGDYAFHACREVSVITCDAITPPSCGLHCFDYIPSTATLYVPYGTSDAYKNAEGWNYFNNVEELEAPSTDLTLFTKVLYIESAEGKTGSQAKLSLKMNNDIPIAGFQCDVEMPEGISVAMDEDEYYLIDLSTERTTAKRTNTFDSALQPDGSIRILAGSTKSCAFEGNEGEVATITVNIDENLEEGEYPMILKNIVMFGVDGTPYRVDRMMEQILPVSLISNLIFS